MKKALLFILLLILTVNVKANYAKGKNKVTLKSCVDGDTANFIYQNQTIKVRFLAIDSPELEHEEQEEEPYAMEARNYTCNKLKNAQKIYIEFDEKSDIKDKYDRYLAWVFVDDELLQEKIVENGYAKVAYLYDDYKYTRILKQKERIAKRKKRGIWYNSKNYDYFFFIGSFIVFLLLLLLHKKMS